MMVHERTIWLFVHNKSTRCSEDQWWSGKQLESRQMYLLVARAQRALSALSAQATSEKHVPPNIWGSACFCMLLHHAHKTCQTKNPKSSQYTNTIKHTMLIKVKSYEVVIQVAPSNFLSFFQLFQLVYWNLYCFLLLHILLHMWHRKPRLRSSRAAPWIPFRSSRAQNTATHVVFSASQRTQIRGTKKAKR